MGILAKAIRGFLEGDHQFCYSDEKSERSDAGVGDSAISDRNGQEKNVGTEYFSENDQLVFSFRSGVGAKRRACEEVMGERRRSAAKPC